MCACMCASMHVGVCTIQVSDRHEGTESIGTSGLGMLHASRRTCAFELARI